MNALCTERGHQWKGFHLWFSRNGDFKRRQRCVICKAKRITTFPAGEETFTHKEIHRDIHEQGI